MTAMNRALNPALLAARSVRPRLASWVVVDGIAETIIEDQCCLALVVATSSPSGEWLKIIARSVLVEHRDAAIADIHIEAERSIRAIALVHGAIEVFVTPYSSADATVVWRSKKTAAPLSLHLRAFASRMLLQTKANMALTLIKPAIRAARSLMQRTATEQTMSDIASRLPPVKVATDASLNTSSKQAAIGWATDHGDYGSALIKRGTKIHVAEYAALIRGIERVLKRHPGRRVLVYSDSKPAIYLLKRRGVNRQDIDTLLQIGVIRVAWVRGHCGHPLNEAAHRLAVHARRSVEWKIPTEHRAQVQRKIVAELWEQLAGGGGAGVAAS